MSSYCGICSFFFFGLRGDGEGYYNHIARRRPFRGAFKTAFRPACKPPATKRENTELRIFYCTYWAEGLRPDAYVYMYEHAEKFTLRLFLSFVLADL